MSICRRLEDYRAGFLEETELDEFESHLERCRACRASVESSRGADEELRGWLNDLPAPEPSKEAADRLVDAARSEAPSGLRLGVLVPVALAAGVAIALSVFLFNRTEPVEDAGVDPDRLAEAPDRLVPRVVASVAGRIEPAASGRGEILSVDGDGRLIVEVGDDRIGLGDNSRAEIVRAGRADSLVKVYAGEVGFDVEPRRGTGEFRVSARGFTVEVVGTRFRVAVDEERGVEVAVASGEVALIEPGGERHAVESGRLLGSGDDGAGLRSSDLDSGSLTEIAALLDENADPSQGPSDEVGAPLEVEDAGQDRSLTAGRAKSPRLGDESAAETVAAFDRGVPRSLILEGRYVAARELLEGHLEGAPGDAASWMLLADCLRKTKAWQDAVRAYQRVVDSGAPRAANRARFRAAVVLQDRLGRYREAAQLLEEYLGVAGAARPLESEAMLRLARASLALGQRQRGANLLGQILEQHAGTSAAVQARQLLSTLQDE